MINCSNNGFCNIPVGDFKCTCQDYYTGHLCEIDTRPCSNKFACRHNGTCENVVGKSGLLDSNCTCTEPFFGKHCEHMRNVCQHVTCNNHGKCFRKVDVPICK